MPNTSRFSAKSVQRLLLHLLCLVPAAWLFYLAASDGLGANPAEALLRSLGDWAIRFICFALAVTPLRQWLRWNGLAAYRRMLGLYAFFYASLHWLILLALAVTSVPRIIRRMGGKRWQMLHRAVYGAAALAVLHFWWMRSGKNNFAEVWLYGLILAGLLVARWVFQKRKQMQAAAKAARA